MLWHEFAPWGDFNLMELKRLQEVEQLQLSDWYKWVKDIPFVGMTADECVGRVLTGQLQAIIGIDKKPEGIVIYHLTSDRVCHIVGVWSRGNLQKYLDMFYTLLKDAGIKKTTAVSVLPEKTFKQVTKMNRSYINYEKEL